MGRGTKQKDMRLATLTDAIESDYNFAAMIYTEVVDGLTMEDKQESDLSRKMEELTNTLDEAHKLALTALGLAVVSRSYLAGT